jgi:uncharacterized protein YggE
MLSDVEITVRGSHTREVPPERALVHIQVGFDGADPDDVVTQTSAAVAEVRSTIEPLVEPAPGSITQWSSDQLRTWSERPWNQQGDQFPLVHHAQQSFEIEFADFAALGGWLANLVAIAGASVGGVSWALTDERRDAVIAEVRTAAIHDARAKAESYAEALGLIGARPIAVADAGMLSDGSPAGGGAVAMAMAARMKDASPAIELIPRDLTVTADVDARFVARSSTEA